MPASAFVGQPSVCLVGIVQRLGPVGIPFRGTHLLIGAGGQPQASLLSQTVNLDQLVGRVSLVCGVSEGVIEGLPAIAVTFAQPLFFPPVFSHGGLNLQ